MSSVSHFIIIINVLPIGRSMASKFAKTVRPALSSLIPRKILLSIHLTFQSSATLPFIEPPLLLTNDLLSVPIQYPILPSIHYRFYQFPFLSSHQEHLFICLLFCPTSFCILPHTLISQLLSSSFLH